MNTILKSDNGIFDIETDYTNYDVMTLANNFNPIFDFYTDLAEVKIYFKNNILSLNNFNIFKNLKKIIINFI